jgi:DNA-directed RNA polymerase subunit alpha
MENLLLPKKISFEQSKDANKATLTVEPCYFGYGTSLGNALRRVLLSSLPGAAVTAVKIAGVDQEFQAIEGVKEDALTICLNLKNLRMKIFSDEPVKLSLIVKGKKVVTAADFDKDSDVEIVTPDLEIANLTDAKSKLEMEITVEQSRGYQPTEERSHDDVEIGNILVDSVFSPVKKVGYKVVPTRVGDITNYDKLVMDIETDGTVTPEEATQQSAKILIEHFSLLLPGEAEADPSQAQDDTAEEAKVEEVEKEVKAEVPAEIEKEKE